MLSIIVRYVLQILVPLVLVIITHSRINRDLPYPLRQVFRVLNRTNTPENADKCLLKNVLGLFFTSRKPPAQAKNLRPEEIVQCSLRPWIA